MTKFEYFRLDVTQYNIELEMKNKTWESELEDTSSKQYEELKNALINEVRLTRLKGYSTLITLNLRD